MSARLRSIKEPIAEDEPEGGEAVFFSKPQESAARTRRRISSSVPASLKTGIKMDTRWKVSPVWAGSVEDGPGRRHQLLSSGHGPPDMVF
jgi:hypothetical protein